jgi:hypothetical protein
MRKTLAIAVVLTLTGTANGQRGRGSFPPAPAPYHAIGPAAKNPVAKALLYHPPTFGRVTIVKGKTEIKIAAPRTGKGNATFVTSFGGAPEHIPAVRGPIDGPRFSLAQVYVGSALIETSVDGESDAFNYRMGRLAQRSGQTVTVKRDGTIIGTFNP